MYILYGFTQQICTFEYSFEINYKGFKEFKRVFEFEF